MSLQLKKAVPVMFRADGKKVFPKLALMINLRYCTIIEKNCLRGKDLIFLWTKIKSVGATS